MINLFISQAWSFDFIDLLTEKMYEINGCRQSQHYLSIKSVIGINSIYCKEGYQE